MRTIVATALTVLAVAALAWWIKGDWELGWLLWMPALPVAGAGVGLLAAAVARGSLAPPMFVGALAGAAALWAAISTPHRWTGADRAAAERRAAAMADSISVFEARARELLRAGVEAAGVQPKVHGGDVHKRPFSLLPEHEPVSAAFDVAFDLGPVRPLRLRLEDGDLVAAPASLDSARAAPWVLRQDALRRRFDAHAVAVGGHGPWPQGALVAIRLERAASDWTLLVARVGGEAGLETVRTVSRGQSRAALARAAAAAGREVRDVLIYFAPRGGGISYLPSGAFDFLGLPVDRRANLRLIARLDGDDFAYAAGSWR